MKDDQLLDKINLILCNLIHAQEEQDPYYIQNAIDELILLHDRIIDDSKSNKNRFK